MSTKKNKFEKFPSFKQLLAACITSISIGVGATSWFWNHSSSLKEIEFENKLSDERYDCKSEKDDLKLRLTSIERQVGKEKYYFDVSKIAISSASLPILHKTHKPFCFGKFYVAPPVFEEWESKPASQLDLIPLMFDKKNISFINQKLGSIGIIISEKTGILWKGNNSIEVQLPSGCKLNEQLDGNGLKLSPFVFAMPIDFSIIKKIHEDFGKGTDANQVSLGSEDEGKLNGSSIDKLSDLYRSDLAGFFLADFLMLRWEFSLLTDAKMKIVSAQKKGNIFYIRIQTVFPSANTDKTKKKHNVIFDEEMLFIGTAESGVIVRIGVPSIDFQTAAYEWTRAWLISLRVPID